MIGPDVFCRACGDCDYGPWGFDDKGGSGELLCEDCLDTVRHLRGWRKGQRARAAELAKVAGVGFPVEALRKQERSALLNLEAFSEVGA